MIFLRIAPLLASIVMVSGNGSPDRPAGAELYRDNCAACHQSTGKGIPGAFPALAGNALVTGKPAPLVKTLLDGRGGMPSFRDSLGDGELSSVAGYIRGSWGNRAGGIPASQFAGFRSTKRGEVKRQQVH
jgi:cytochrome c6